MPALHRPCFWPVLVVFAIAIFSPRSVAEEKPAELVRKAVGELIKMQEDSGQWPYEGVYRVNREIPIGYRVGGTAIVAQTLLFAAPDDKEARAAVSRGRAFVLKGLAEPLMEAS